MKKLTAFLMAIITCIPLFSCNASGGKTEQVKEINIEELSEVAYKQSTVELPDSGVLIFCIETYNKGEDIFLLGTSRDGNVFYRTDKNFSEFTEVEIPEFKSYTAYDIDVAEDGTVVEIINDADYGGLPDPDPYAADFDESLYKENAVYNLSVREYAPDGGLKVAVPVEGLPFEEDESLSIMAMDSDSTRILTNINGSHYVIGRDGSFQGEITAEDAGGEITHIGKDRDGKLYCAVVPEDGKLQVRPLSDDKTELEPAAATYTIDETVVKQLMPGTGEYLMYVVTSSAIYGINAEDFTMKEVFSIKEAGFVTTVVSDIYLAEDGSLVTADLGASRGSCLKRYDACDPAELENIPIIKVGVMHDSYILKEYVNEINNAQSDYRVEIESYSDLHSGEEYSAIMDSFAEDVLAGNLPDVLVVDHYGRFGDVNMYDMDALCDLGEFLDKDEELTRDKFVPNILELLKDEDGSIPIISSTFSLNLGYVGKTEFVGDIEKLDIPAFIDLVHNLPEGMAFSADNNIDTKDARFWYANTIDYFVDEEKMTCDFDNDEFVQWLKFCNEAPPEVENAQDYSNMSEEELNDDYNKRNVAYIENKALLYNDNFSTYEGYFYTRKGQFGGADVTAIGEVDRHDNKPSIDLDTECYAIPKASENKELAWKFIKSMFTDEYYRYHTVWHDENGSSVRGGFPITKSGLDVLAENEQVDRVGGDRDGYTGLYAYINGENVEIGHLTDEWIDEVNEIIYSVDKRTAINKFYELNELIYAEVKRCFNGECTEEECARIVQDMATKYLAEHS